MFENAKSTSECDLSKELSRFCHSFCCRLFVWFGLNWSLELYEQANARLWRQGQTADTVVIHHIIAKDTIDERIMTALRKKEKTQTALIDAVKANLEG